MSTHLGNVTPLCMYRDERCRLLGLVGLVGHVLIIVIPFHVFTAMSLLVLGIIALFVNAMITGLNAIFACIRVLTVLNIFCLSLFHIVVDVQNKCFVYVGSLSLDERLMRQRIKGLCSLSVRVQEIMQCRFAYGR